jgi:hypothetical protein
MSFDAVQYGPYHVAIDQTFLLSNRKDAASFRYSRDLERRLIAQSMPRFVWHATVLESGEGVALCQGAQIVQPSSNSEGSEPPVDRVLRFEARQVGKDSFQLALRQATEALKACQAVELPEDWTANKSHHGRSERQLPAGWVSHVSRSTGDTYYVNVATQESTYNFPSAPTPEAVVAAESSGSPAVLEVAFEEEGPVGMTVGNAGQILRVEAQSLAERQMITSQHTIKSIEGVPVLGHHTSRYITDQLSRRPVRLVLSIERPTRHS